MLEEEEGKRTKKKKKRKKRLMSSSSMGYIYHYHPAFWRKYHYLTAVGLDCGSQLMSTIMALGISLPHVTFPKWWGNNPTFPDRYELTDISLFLFLGCF